MVQDGDSKETSNMLKEQIYNIVAHTGIWLMGHIFPEYFAKESLHPTDRDIEYPFVLRSLLPPPLKIMDVGCAGSMLPYLLKALKYDVCGIDIRSTSFCQGDICNAPFKSNSFDIITCVSTLEHIGLIGRYGVKKFIEPGKAMAEIYRLLKPHGLLLMTVPFASIYRVERYHRVFDEKILKELLVHFTYSYELIVSPEGLYFLCLIRAMKNEYFVDKSPY